MMEQKDPEHISSHGHPKITIIYRATIDKKSQKTSRKDLLQLNKEGATTREQKEQRCDIVKIHTPGCVTHKQEDNQSCRGSPQGVSDLSPTSGRLREGVLHLEDEPPEHLALKANGPYFREIQRNVGNRNSALKECTQNLTCSGTQGRGRNSKETWVRLTDWSWRASWRGRRQLTPTLRTQTLAGAIVGGLFYPWTPVLARAILEFPLYLISARTQSCPPAFQH